MKRDKKNAILAGVCAGIANYLNVPVLVIRLLFVFFTFWVGGGLLAYLLCWLLMPAENGVTSLVLQRDEANGVLGGVCAGLANAMGINVVVLRILWVISTLYFGVGIIPYLILWLLMPKKQA